MNNNKYNNQIISRLTSLQKDLKDKKLTEEQFNFLIGFLLKSEVNNFVNEQIESFLPESEEKHMTLINYKINTKLTHA